MSVVDKRSSGSMSDTYWTPMRHLHLFGSSGGDESRFKESAVCSPLHSEDKIAFAANVMTSSSGAWPEVVC